MRISPRLLLLALLLVTCVSSSADAPPAAPARVTEPGVFSYQLPPGWISVEVQHMYPIAVERTGPVKKEQAKAMISVTTKSADGDLANWCAQSMQQNKAQFAALGAQVSQLEPFLTGAGAIGYCALIDVTVRGHPLHYILFFFDGGDGTKITVTCACPAADTAHYAPLFAAAMKTFVPH